MDYLKILSSNKYSFNEEGIILYIILFFLIFPLISAIILRVAKNEKIRGSTVRITSCILAVLSIFLLFQYFNTSNKYYLINSERITYFILIIELIITGYIISIGIKLKRYIIALLSFTQGALMLWFEIAGNHSSSKIMHHLYIDKLSIIVALIVSIVGGLICIFALPYMRDYHHHHKEIKDRRCLFFSLLFIFISAMYGIIFCNDLVWIYFFWEITTLCSFLLIGYSASKEAIQNSFTALFMNLIGGLCFALAIVYLGQNYNLTELQDVIKLGSKDSRLVIPAILLAVAGFSKSAQLPFSKWLLGAMVAPTPTSALLHSSTMVKAGVYLLLRISPMLINNLAGYMVILVGGITFMIMSFIAISQNDAKKILAYSTIANLGLIVACAGVGNYEAIWAGIMLIIFHAVAKSLMFLSVGATEHLIGSRDIEDMHGLIVKLPEMALIMTIGIAGMFLAPFGMLIAKWAALKAFIDSRNVVIIFMLVYGSAATLFYWTKWLGKLASVMHKSERIKCELKADAWFSLIVHAIFTLILCILFPQISQWLILPFLHDMFNISGINIISQGNQHIMVIMLGMITILPFGMNFLTSREEKIVTVYMGGINTGDNKHFEGSMGGNKKMYLSSWYMDKYFNERKLLTIGIFSVLLIIISIVLVAIGGA